mgnify:CR=1 FL=1
MGELLDYVKERFLKSSGSESKELMKKQIVKNSILNLADRLDSTDEALEIEVSKSDLPYVPEVIYDEQITSKYNITQIGETLFIIKLKEIDFS